MSYNQSRPDRSETQYRRTGRSTTTGGYHHQQQQQQQRSKGGAAAAASGVSPPVAAAPAPSSSFDSSSNRSFKKSGNAQGGQARVNLPPHSNHNGPHVQSRSQGVAGEPVNQAGAIPKAPASQSTVVSSKSNETANTAKVSGDPSKAFAFQFGSLGPDLMKIPARTSSAPPNMDEQKRAQMQASLRTAQNVPASAPKKDSPNKAADNHLMRKEGHNLSSEKADGQVPHIPPPSQMQKSPITTIRMPAVQTPFQHGQVPHPVHFGGPNMHMQPPTVTATSFQIPQMPMPMALSLGNTPQIQQQVFFQSLPSHPMHHQGMMHQAQGHGFATSMGPQIHPQLGHVGVGMSPQYPQQQGGKYSGARKTTPVKITHPDTHEELRLDRRGDPRPDGEPVASKPHSNTPPRSQPASAFGPRPVNLVQTSYNSSPMIYPPVSMPLNSGPMSSAQAPRYHFQGNDGPQRAQFINQSAHTAPQLVRPAAPAQVLSDSTSSTKARDAQNVISSVLPASTKVTVKPAAASEKHGSPKARSHEEVSISLPQKDVEAGSLSSQQPKPGFVSGQPKSSAPPAKSSLETSPVATTEMGRGEMVNESNSVEDQKRTEDRGQTMPEDPVVSDLSPPSSFSAPETDIVAAKANSSVPATNGFSKKLMEVSLTSDAPTSNSLGTNIDKTTEGSSHASSEKDLKCDEQTISDKHVERSVISEEKHETISGGKGQNEVDGVIDVCPVSENLADVTDDKSSELPHSTQIQSSTVPLGHSEILPKQLGVDNSGDSLISAPATLSKDKSASELNSRRNTSTKGKKKIKEILQKADAAGTTSDLYMAYKGPEEKKEITTPSESAHVIHDASNQKLASAVPQAVAEATVDAEPVKNEPEDWEDAADVSTPKLDTADFRAHAQRGSSDEARDSGSNTEKKYSRDFLLKFADLFTALPEGFDVSPDIANALICANMGTSHHENDLYPTTGKVMDRQGSGARLDRRPSNMVVDDRWTKNQGSMSAGYGGNTGFRPGPGVNSGVLRNPRNQGPLMSRPTQSVGPGMGRNNPELERWQRGSNFQQKGLFPSPHTPMQVMHKAERKYQVGTIADEEQAKQRQLKGILNKLTPQNFDKLFEQVKNVNIDNAVTLSGVISQIFDKALMEPTFCEMYADFCLHLSGALPDFNENGEKITFKRLLLNKCQEEFERGEKEEEEASRVAEEGQVQQTEEEREEKRLKVRRRMLGNIRLIGELYKKRMLTEKIMHACIQKLLGYDQDPHEENIEALCKLMSTIGVMIDHNRAKVHMDAYFEKMKMLSNKQELSSRVRFMLINAIDLRKNKWQERMKVEGPKKIEEVHRDAAQERQTQANRISRGPSMNSSARRGHMEFSPRGGGGMLSPPSAQMGGFHGPPQNRGYGNQDIRFDERAAYEPRMVPMPQRSVGEEPIMLGPQGGLGQGMSIRRPAVASNTMQSDATQAGGDSRRPAGGLNGFGSQRPASPATHGRLGPQERGAAYVHRDFGSLSRPSDPSSEVSSARQVLHGPSSTVSSPRESALSEEKLRDMSLSAIKEYYSARDEKEIGMCMKDMNSSAFHPTMISLWVTDSFERKDKERDLLAKLLVSLVKSVDNALTDVELVKGFESVLTTLEDAVNDAPRAAEFLGKIFGKSVTENVVSLTEIGRLVREGGEEPGSLIEFGLGGDVVGSVLEMIKTEAGEEALVEIRRSSGLRIEDFKPPAPTRSKILERFT